ncbi:Ubiquitin fusion degradation protein-2, partial [Trachipleistophora hominis]
VFIGYFDIYLAQLFYPHMIRREVFKFFDIKEKITDKTIPENEVEDLFISEMDSWTEEKGIFAFHLIDNYRTSYSLDFKEKILSYISMVLLNPDIVPQSIFAVESGPLVLMRKIVDECDLSYHRIYDCLKDLAEYCDEECAMRILIPLIYQCGKEASRLNLLENFAKYLNAVMMLITIEKVQVWFCDGFIWGLCDSSLFQENDFYRGFMYETNCPCFLDGFMEVFIYEKADLFTRADLVMNKDISELRNIGTMIIHKLEYLAQNVFDILLKLVRKCEKIKNNFLNYLILIVNNNKNRAKMVYDYTEVISDGFAINFNNVLALFCGQIVRKQLFNLINIKVMKIFDLKSIKESENREDQNKTMDEQNGTGYQTGDVSESGKSGSKTQNLSFSTVVLFAKLIFANYSYIKFLEHIKLLDNEIYSMELMQSERDSHSQLEYLRKELESKCFALRIIFSCEFFKQQEEPITSFLIEFTEHVDFCDLPHLYFEVVFQIQTLLIREHQEFLSNRLLGLIEKIMCSKIRNLHFKESVIKILELKTSSLTERLFHALILFYSDLHHFDEFFYEKFSIRYHIHNVLMNDLNEHIKSIAPSTENLRFVNFVIDDTESQLSSALNSIIEIKRCEERLKHTNDREERRSLKSNMLRAKKKATSSFVFVDSSLKMVSFLVEECSILTRNEVLKKFVTILNCNLKMIVGPKCNDLHIKNPDEYNFRPKELLRKIIMVYLKMSNDVYLNAIVQDHSYFNLSLFKRACFICETKFILGQNDLSLFKRLVSKLEAVQNEIVEDDEIVPDEFIDPITCDPIRDPVILLTSNVTVDRSTFDAIMLGDQVDPFNREVLDESKVRDNEEMKKKLDVYWESRIKK